MDATRWVASFDFPDFQRDYEMVALSHPGEYAMNEGRIVSMAGLSIEATDYEREFTEHQVAHSTALHSTKSAGKTCYHVGPLARVNLNFDRLSPSARQVADEIGFNPPSSNPFQAIIARGLEVIHAYEEGLEILRDYRPFDPPRTDYRVAAGEGCAATEAPRGLLYHRYAVDDDGKITFAKIVPPTSQNQGQIEADLRAWLPGLLGEDDSQTARACERLIRSYDPCISCSTHFLKLRVERKV